MIEHIDITKVEDDFNPLEILKEARVKPTDEIEKNPVAVSAGHKYNEFIPFVSYGNFSAIVGKSKSKKTFLKTAINACYIGGKAQNRFPDIQGHDNKNKWVIEFDTEQSKSHVWRSTKRIESMVGNDYPYYAMFSLRPYEPGVRVKFIEWVLYESSFKGNIGLVTIDGVADLVNNTNDLLEANMIMQKYLKWTQELNIALITVIHRAFGVDKSTGHVGSAIEKKCEVVIGVTSEEHNVEVICKMSRNIHFDDFVFTIDQFGIPEQSTEEISF